ncbi:GNAT family N-acetyltransferase [Nocardioides anomalus]|uniref:GNAT family N-acetyltransferase n=1 Tax=Nocardioides anomalus TaxID=2712223 RepID=A0A6G6WGB4_9ACTN|nr:GNAT family N-acetyltransferase [Nocardioides anomalus]QIG44249.1 GNAT family N-acetyltransferase [Nocardioides anomalus]
MSSDAGAHTLGPHVVGQRVVVRRILRGETGPSGGPALTDVLGTCTAWGDGICVVARDSSDGSPTDTVTIALADIVSGKPVPPRPSPRLRVDPVTAQHRGMTLFPGLETSPLGAWTLRRSTTYAARRANSVLAMTDPGLSDAEAYAGVVDFYTAHGARPIAAVLRDTAPEALFLSHGWVSESGDADTVFELASVAGVARALRGVDAGGVELDEDGDLVTARLDTRASGVAAVDGDWVGFRSIAVDAGHRRQGLGLAVMAALVERSAERGAATAYLQVLGDNDPALGLYERLGFVEHHRYRYLASPLS